MKLLIDMSLSPYWVEFLAGNGIDSAHWSAVGSPMAPDREIFDYAANHGWIVFTHDLDFGALLAISGSKGPSVIQVRGQDVLPSVIGHVIVNAIKSAHQHLNSGALITIDLAGHRTRILPIR